MGSDGDVARQALREKCIDQKARHMRTGKGSSRSKDVGMTQSCWRPSRRWESLGMKQRKHCLVSRGTKQHRVKQDPVVVAGVGLEVQAGSSFAAGNMPQHR